MSRTRTPGRFAALLVVVVLTLGLVAGAAGAQSSKDSAKSEPVTLRLGYFPNVTHAPALVGVEGGIFEKTLGTNVDARDSRPSTPGTEAVEALLAERARRHATSARTRPSTRSTQSDGASGSSPARPRAARSSS